MLLCLITGST